MWQDQLQPASFRDVPFMVRTVALEGGKKGDKHDRPKRKGGSVEDLGNKINTYNIEIILAGEDCIEQRIKLEKAFETKGPGELIIPTRGSVEALPTQWSVTENIAEQGKYLVIQAAFSETRFPNLPQLIIESADSAITYQPEIVEAASARYMEMVDLEDAAILERGLTDLQSSIAAVNSAIKGVVDDVNDAFNDLSTVIDSTIDELMLANPLTILANVQNLINLPSTILNQFDKLKTKYTSLIENTLDVFPFTYASNKAGRAQCAHAEMITGAAIIGLAGSAGNSSFRSRGDIVSANILVADLFDTYTERLDEYTVMFGASGQYYEPLEQNRFSPGYETLALISRVVSETSNSLIKRSFELPAEIVITLNRDRTLLDLAYELYANTDSAFTLDAKVDELIFVNSINDPWLLPKGLELTYYA